MMLEEWYFDIPVVTRTYLTLAFLVSLACKLDLVSPIHLFYSPSLLTSPRQYHRLLTTFLYHGSFSLDYFFNMYFLSRHSRMLEESSFHSNPIDYLWMLVVGASGILALASAIAVVGGGERLVFLASALSGYMVYVWARRNPNARMNLFGIMNFNAPYLPWVMLAFPIVLYGEVSWHDVLGLIVGHCYYFFEDVYPRLHGSGGRRYLATPQWFRFVITRLAGIRDFSDATMPVPAVSQPARPVVPIVAAVNLAHVDIEDAVKVDEKKKEGSEWVSLDGAGEGEDAGGYSWGDVKRKKAAVVTEEELKTTVKDDGVRKRG